MAVSHFGGDRPCGDFHAGATRATTRPRSALFSWVPTPGANVPSVTCSLDAQCSHGARQLGGGTLVRHLAMESCRKMSSFIMSRSVLGVCFAVGLAGGSAGHAAEAGVGQFDDQALSAHDADPHHQEVKALFAAEQRGIDLYRAGAFERAYSELAEPAAKGLKVAQQLMGLMYLRGEGVEKHPLKGVALLGLAAETGDKTVERQYSEALKRVPDQFRDVVRQQVQFYIARYGMAAQGISCKRTRKPQSHFTAMDCDKAPGDYEVYPWAP